MSGKTSCDIHQILINIVPLKNILLLLVLFVVDAEKKQTMD